MVSFPLPVTLRGFPLPRQQDLDAWADAFNGAFDEGCSRRSRFCVKDTAVPNIRHLRGHFFCQNRTRFDRKADPLRI